jgi:hypothetical protein
MIFNSKHRYSYSRESVIILKHANLCVYNVFYNRDCIPIVKHFTVYKSWMIHDPLSEHLVLVYLSLYIKAHLKGILFCGHKMNGKSERSVYWFDFGDRVRV